MSIRVIERIYISFFLPSLQLLNDAIRLRSKKKKRGENYHATGVNKNKSDDKLFLYLTLSKVPFDESTAIVHCTIYVICD